MRKLIFITALSLISLPFFSQDNTTDLKKGTNIIEVKNPQIGFGQNHYSSAIGLGYGKFITNRLTLSANFNNRIGLTNQLSSYYLGLGIDARYYIGNTSKNLRFYGKLQSEVGKAFGSMHEDFSTLSLYGLLGTEYSISNRVALFFEGGYGTNLNLQSNTSVYTPKANFGLRIFF